MKRIQLLNGAISLSAKLYYEFNKRFADTTTITLLQAMQAITDILKTM